MKKVIMLIMPLMLTVVSVQAQNQKEMKGSNSSHAGMGQDFPTVQQGESP